MSSGVQDFVMEQPLFSHHDHHCHFKEFEENRSGYDAKSLLGYADWDIETAAGIESDGQVSQDEKIAAHWQDIRTTGYGRAVSLGCKMLFGLEYSPENFGAITEKLRSVFKDRPAPEIYDYFVKEKANNRWVLQDGYFRPGIAKTRNN